MELHAQTTPRCHQKQVAKREFIRKINLNTNRSKDQGGTQLAESQLAQHVQEPAAEHSILA